MYSKRHLGDIRPWADNSGTRSVATADEECIVHYTQVNSQGCVVDGNDDVWVAHSLFFGKNTVGHVLNDGTFVGNVTVGLGPTGVAVDAQGKIWSANINSSTASRIDPTAGPIGGGGVPIGAVDLTVNLGDGGGPYNYSDMTGSTLIAPPNSGTWTVIFDSGIAGVEWGFVTWTSDEIWPPNLKFVPVSILGVTDPDGDPVTITIDSIFQDEPVDTFGDGSFTPDGQGVGTDAAEVRAERAGTKKVPGDGRVYHVGFTADDGRGGECTGTATICVPHDQRPGHVCVDQGPLYDSTALSP